MTYPVFPTKIINMHNFKPFSTLKPVLSNSLRRAISFFHFNNYIITVTINLHMYFEKPSQLLSSNLKNQKSMVKFFLYSLLCLRFCSKINISNIIKHTLLYILIILKKLTIMKNNLTILEFHRILFFLFYFFFIILMSLILSCFNYLMIYFFLFKDF